MPDFLNPDPSKVYSQPVESSPGTPARRSDLQNIVIAVLALAGVGAAAFGWGEWGMALLLLAILIKV